MILKALEKFVDLIYAAIPRETPKSMVNTKVIAHRGAHGGRIIENTIPAFTLAQQLGCFGIELDIQVTKDRKIVVHHDPELKRLWGADEAIKNLTLEELQKVAPDIPTLNTVIKKFGKKLKLFIELKAPFDAENELVAVLHSLQEGLDYYLLSLDKEIFSSISKFKLSSLFLVADFNNTRQFIDVCLKNYAGVLGHYLLLTQYKINKLQDRRTGVGFVDSKHSLYREVNRGVEWIFTNKAKKICNLIQG